MDWYSKCFYYTGKYAHRKIQKELTLPKPEREKLILLIIGHSFPEPDTTAAGSRIMQLIAMFNEKGAKITFATSAGISERSVKLQTYGVSVEKIKLNDSSFDDFIKNLDPNIILFDRFVTEEQFGWRVAEICPNAFRILDTEDLHFLRKAREEGVNNGLRAIDANLFTELAKRELASILRSDLTLIISEVEMKLLISSFKISEEILCYLPFLVESPSEDHIEELPNFKDREHFITVGNFQHAPNVDSVKWLRKDIWPRIKEVMPNAELHIYGAYAPQQLLELHDIKSGFLIKGWIEDIDIAMQQARVCLAPLRFGAGLKGKIFDALLNGTPVVTTAIGAEGINKTLAFAGAVSEDNIDIVSHSVELYNDELVWNNARDNGFMILEERFDKDRHIERFRIKLEKIHSDLEAHRKSNFLSQILQHANFNATKYMSKWIEEKHRTNEK